RRTEALEARVSVFDKETPKTTETILSEADLKPSSPRITSVHSLSRNTRNAWYAAIGVIGLLSLIGIISFKYLHRSSGEMNVKTIAVLPFKNESGDAEDEYLSDGITENIISALSDFPKPRVIAQSRVFGYKGRNIDPQKVGGELNVDAVVTGTVA